MKQQTQFERGSFRRIRASGLALLAASSVLSMACSQSGMGTVCTDDFFVEGTGTVTVSSDGTQTTDSVGNAVLGSKWSRNNRAAATMTLSAKWSSQGTSASTSIPGGDISLDFMGFPPGTPHPLAQLAFSNVGDSTSVTLTNPAGVSFSRTCSATPSVVTLTATVEAASGTLDLKNCAGESAFRRTVRLRLDATLGACGMQSVSFESVLMVRASFSRAA